MLEQPLTPHIWLQVSPVARNALAKAFGMKRTGSPLCVVERGISRIESDGFTVNDLRALNAESMQQFLGFQEVDPEANLAALLEMCADKVTPAPVVVEEVTEPELPVVLPVEPAVVVAPAPTTPKMGRPKKVV